MPGLLNKLAGFIAKLVPGKGGRSALIAISGLIYGISGIISGNLDGEGATKIILVSLGLIFAAKHTE